MIRFYSLRHLPLAALLLLCGDLSAAPASVVFSESAGAPGRQSVSASILEQSVGTFLSTGQTVTFELPAVQNSTLFVGATGGFRVFAPAGTRSITIDLEGLTPGVDLDLAVRFDAEIGENPDVESDYISFTPGSSSEQVVIDASSSPPVQEGFYFIGLVLRPSANPVIAQITATVDSDTPATVGQLLQSGVPANFNIPAVAVPSIAGANFGFRVDIPPGAQQLRIRATAMDANARMSIYARQGFDIVLDPGQFFYFDWGNTTGAGTNDETLTITGLSSPALRTGTVFIALGLLSTGVPFTGTITATVTVGNPPAIALSKSLIELNRSVGDPQPFPETFFVSNIGSGTLEYSLSADQPWVTLSATTGSSTAELDPIQVFVNTSGLGVGSHVARITISEIGGSGEAVVQVRVNISSGDAPQIELSKQSLVFDVASGDSGAETIEIRNSGGGVLNFEIEATPFWLSSSIPGGSSAGQPVQATIRADSAEIPPGRYQGQVTIRDTTAGLEQTIGVQLNAMASVPTPFATATALMFEAEIDAGNPPAQTFSVGNAGPGELTYTIVSSQPWLSASPMGGVVTDGLDEISVAVNVAGLAPGVHAGGLKIDPAGQNAMRVSQGVSTIVPVTLTIIDPGPVPILVDNAMVNAASFAPFGAPGHRTAPGSIVSIFGLDFALGLSQAESVPLPLALGGATVKINGVPAPLFFVSPMQINAQLPASLIGNQATVVVTNAFGANPPAMAQIAIYSPAIFTFTQTGGGQGIVTYAAVPGLPAEEVNALAAPAGLAGASRPARTGDVLTVWANGLGPVTPAISDGRNSFDPDGFRLRNTTARPTVRIGGAAVPDGNILFSGLAPEFVGLNQVNLIVPAGLASGAAVPIVIEVGGTSSRDDVTIALQ